MTLLDITESLCLAVDAGNLGEARALARDLRARMPAKRSGLRINPAAIVSAVCERYNLDASELKGPERHHDIAHPRAIAMFLMRQLTEMSYPRIGAYFGGRDHTTALAAYQKVTRWVLDDNDIAADVAKLRAHFGATEAA